jgi:hypothetical protein
MTRSYIGLPGFDVGSDDPPPPPARVTKSNNVLNPYPTATVTLRGISIPLNSDIGGAFLAECARNKERLVSDEQICERFGIEPNAWATIIKDPAVRLAVTVEHERRVRNGDAARESAAKLFAGAPEVLGRILNDPKASPRHVIEASKELRATARADDEKNGDTAERVVVNIRIGNAPEDNLTFDCGPLKQQTKEAIDAE